MRHCAYMKKQVINSLPAATTEGDRHVHSIDLIS